MRAIKQLPVPKLIVLVGLLGCGEGERALLWRLELDEADRSRAELVQARVLRGGCDGTDAVYSATLRRSDTTVPMQVPDLAPGTWGFWARAQDATCTWFVTGCTERTLPIGQGETVATAIDRPIAERDPACGGDAGPIDAGGVDGGEVDAGGGDGGGVDAGPPPPRCPFPPSWDEDVVWTESVYVSPTGNDGADGTAAGPVRTLGEALSRASTNGAPTRIVLAAGTYGGVDTIGVGSAAAPVRIEGPREAIVDGGGASEAIYISDVSHVVLAGFTVRNASELVRIERRGGAADRVVLRDLALRDPVPFSECVRLYAVTDFRIERLDVQGCSAGMRLLTVQNGLVLDNRVTDSPTGYGISTEGGAIDVYIHGNFFIDLGEEAIRAGGNSDITYIRPGATEEAARIYAVGNFIRRVGGSDGRGAMSHATCNGCVFAHNVIVEPRLHLFDIVEGNGNTALVPTRDGWFVNNLIIETGMLADYVFVGAGRVEPATFTIGSNMFWDYDDPTFDHGALASDVTESTPSISGVDPLVISRGAGDYHLMAGSPASGAGRDDVPYGAFAPAQDTDELCWRNPPAIGGYERY